MADNTLSEKTNKRFLKEKQCKDGEIVICNGKTYMK